MLYKEHMTSYKHLAFIQLVSFNRHHWCGYKVGDYHAFLTTELFIDNSKLLQLKLNDLIF